MKQLGESVKRYKSSIVKETEGGDRTIQLDVLKNTYCKINLNVLMSSTWVKLRKSEQPLGLCSPCKWNTWIILKKRKRRCCLGNYQTREAVVPSQLTIKETN